MRSVRGTGEPLDFRRRADREDATIPDRDRFRDPVLCIDGQDAPADEDPVGSPLRPGARGQAPQRQHRRRTQTHVRSLPR